jgi:SAM-dependent methyltransferase
VALCAMANDRASGHYDGHKPGCLLATGKCLISPEGMHHVSLDDITTNYSQIGVELIEMMYSDGYLSMGGLQSTDILARQSGITGETRVLDVGSGLGGPALYLAQTYGCHVTGLDLIDLSVRKAAERARHKDLDHLVDFRQGDALIMPFENGIFDVVLGQDSWCHVPDKDKLIEECTRVLAPTGTVAFTDWIQVGDMSDAYRDDVLSASASSDFASLQAYCDLLDKHGFDVLVREDISADFTKSYRDIIAGVKRMEFAISDKFAPKIFNIILEKNTCILTAFEDSKIGGGRIVGRKR